jgi:hypothetical protein
MGTIGALELVLILFVVLIFATIVLIPYWRIFRKAGFQPSLSLLMIVPLVNVVMLYYLAFAEWPSLRKDQK